MRVLVNGTLYDIEVTRRERECVEFALQGRSYRVEFERTVPQPSAPHKAGQRCTRPKRHAKGPAGGGRIPIIAPIPGVIVEILVSEGEAVQEGDVLIRIEAMKMQNNIFAAESGTVASIAVSHGDEVSDGQLLLELAE